MRVAEAFAQSAQAIGFFPRREILALHVFDQRNLGDPTFIDIHFDARHFFETCLAWDCLSPLEALCRRARRACEAHVDGALAVEVVMVDFGGDGVVARA